MSEGGDRPAEREAAKGVAVGGSDPGRRRGVMVDLRPLRECRDFRLLWIGNGISRLGGHVTNIAVPFQIYSITRSSFAVGLVALCQLIPILTLSLWGGAVADAVDRRKVLIVTDVALGAIALLLAANAALLDRPSLPAIYVLATVSSGIVCFGRPALDAALPRLVPPDLLAPAAALNGFQFTIGGIAGPAVGGVLVATVGIGGAFFLDAATFVASLVAGVMLRPIPPAADAPPPSLRAIAEGLRFARRTPALLGTYAIDLNAMVFGMPDALLPALAIERFGGGAAVLGVLHAAPPAGALLASVFSGWQGRTKRHGRVITYAVVAWGASIAAFGVTNWLPLALVFAACAGGADMVSGVARLVMWNTITPDHLRGRLAGVELASYSSGPAIGNFEAGLVATLTSVRTSIVSGGLACIAGAGVVALVLPGFWRYRQG